eukprot:2539299-Prymnesium_polylepis.1
MHGRRLLSRTSEGSGEDGTSEAGDECRDSFRYGEWDDSGGSGGLARTVSSLSGCSECGAPVHSL